MKILLFFAVVFVGLVLYVRFMEGTTIFLPNKDILYTPKQLGIPFENIFFKTADGVKLNGWLVKSSQGATPGSTMIFLHGNAGNNGDRLEKIQMFQQLGLNVFIVDYRGYGLSEGRPTEQGMYKDALAAYDYLRTRADIFPGKICVYGESLGGAAAVYLAAHRPVAALIADATFSSAADMAKKILPVVPSFLLSVKMDSVSVIKKIVAPKLFIHSVDDQAIPYALGKKLYDAAPPPKQFLKIAGTHNEGHIASRNIYISGLTMFLQSNHLIKGGPRG